MKRTAKKKIAIRLATLIGAMSAGIAWGNAPHPPIAIPFELKEPGYVTLVVEKPDGTRVRNLVSETAFPAGRNMAYWDGLDDLGRDPEAARHSIYNVPGKMVEAGTYRVRGLVRPDLKLVYQFTPYNPGNPPWRTGDLSNGWLANHAPPSAVLWVPAGAAPSRAQEAIEKTGWGNRPLSARAENRNGHTGPQMLIASRVSEGGSGLAWTDTEGNKLHGQTWLGGVWTAASHLARDTGKNAVPGVYAYAAAYWQGDKNNKNVPEIRLQELVSEQASKKPQDTRFGRGDDRPILTPHYRVPNVVQGAANHDIANSDSNGLAGMAVRDGLIVLSVGETDRLVFIDGHTKKIVGVSELKSPRGVEFDADGKLVAISGTSILRFSLPKITAPADFDPASDQPTFSLPAPQVLVSTGLEGPKQIAIDPAGNLFVSDWGNSHQVKMFDRSGTLVRLIGTAGKPSVGPYDPTHMRHPNGMSIDEKGRLWVAESDKSPKRISLWDPATGKFIRAIYGPAKYGGGGNVDPVDPTRYFYSDDNGAMEFKLDWNTGQDAVTSVYYRPDVSDFPIRGKWVGFSPQTPLHRDGKTYLTDSYTTSATDSVRATVLWLLEHGVARPVAAAGQLRDASNNVFWVFQMEAFKAGMPAGTDVAKTDVLFAWSDQNDDGKMQPEETTYFRPSTETVRGQKLVDGMTVQSDLSIAVSIVGNQSVLLRPQGYSPRGAPLFDAARQEVLAVNVNRRASSGHGQVITGENGWAVMTTPPAPFTPHSLGGVKDGKPMWSYPSMWPGLHASHIAPMPHAPGVLIGTTRLLGPTFKVPNNDLGDLFAISGNKGQIYLFTTDGLFVSTLFADSRAGQPWPAEDKPGADVSQTTLNEECFGPTIAQLADGRTIIQGGFNSMLVELQGLGGARRLPESSLQVSNEQLVAAQNYFVQREAARQAAKGSGELAVRVGPATLAPALDGKLADWKDASWVLIDERNKKIGNFGKKLAKTEGAIMIAGDRLYGAIRTDDPDLLNNTGESLQNIFKTGGAIDLMIGTDPSAPDDRKVAAPGDKRLTLTKVKDKTVAVLYEKTIKGYNGPTVEFTSPVQSIRFAKVTDVSAKVELAAGVEDGPENAFKVGLYEFSIALADLGIVQPPTGEVRGDFGILRGNGFETTQRVYWTNKSTGLVSDLPSEADLKPSLWGKFVFVPIK